ncbi:MAG: alpha/beta hydrolase [Actinomycetota bacterium]|nr:alpha/beta hydrolase [Actinomycetota bacterium]
MASRRSKRSRNVRRAVALAATAGGATVVVRQVAGQKWATDDDPCGPEGFTLPDGDHRTVPTDDDAELAVTLTGPADGPVVVLSHCWTGSRAFWSPVARMLAADGHRVVLYDHRGHGASTAGDGRTDLERLAEDLRAVLEELDLTDAVLAGHSMGGMTIQALAKDHPDVVRARVRGIALVATAAKVVPRPMPAAAIEAVLGDRAIGGWFRGPAGVRMVRGALGQVAHRAHVEATRDHFIDTVAAARTGFLVAMSQMDLRPGHVNIEVPTTIVVGTRDRLTPIALAKAMERSIPKAELIVIPKAGHMLPIEHPAEIAAAIESLTPIGDARTKAAATN